MLRNPVERAYSHYKMSVKNGFELLSFKEALEQESNRIEYGKNHLNHNYIFQKLAYRTKGIYINYLKNWYSSFDKASILIIDSNKYFLDPKPNFKKIIEFLDIEDFTPNSFNWKNQGVETAIPPKVKKELIDFYQPYNKELYAFLDENFNWDEI